ncbi:GNAT family N-acetyltransferase [Streptomyces iconiensis]|uniref:GNAT family N-acetyltransferase n=1 Tax=Streptomyces iconiensis TaxID=1384038 RepID=A0ABT7A9Q3_9ACTN|nr:GNAT family N-acetyltransferase [Streptomyces iconiensis]MDJ1138093.1 GNAT family N-acetyltransferase [Streptomyces iconiensis]
MPQPEALVRPVVPDDLKAVAEIYAYYVAETVITFDEAPLSVEDWQRRLEGLEERGLPFVVAESTGRDAGEIAGYAYASPWRPKPAYRYAVEDTLYLAPEHTGRGLGGALLGELTRRSALAGARRMLAVIADTGTGASTALHLRHGFTEAGRLAAVGHKHGRWVDTVLMQRALGE